MSVCHVCGSNESQEEIVSEIFNLDGNRVLVEGIPAGVCARCGDVTLSAETTERARQLVHGNRKNARKLEIDVLALT